MAPRKNIDRKLVNSRKKPVNKRFSDTPKIKTPPRTARNILSQNSKLLDDKCAANKSSARRCSNVPQKSPSTINPSDILKVNWKVFRVSPIYNFEENKLKIYARKLKEELSLHNGKQEKALFSCSFHFQKSLHNHSCDKIQVLLKANNIHYKAYFLSLQEGQCNKEIICIRHFPVLLVHGGDKISKQVHNAFCKFFDCDIQPVRFPFKALITLFGSLSHMYIDEVPNFTSEAVLLHYRIPGCPRSDSIKVALSLAAASTVFAAYMVTFGNDTTDEQMVSGYYEKIIKHLLNVYEIDLSYAQLISITFPEFGISSEGWVKFSSEEILNRTLPIIEKYSGLQYASY